MDHLETLYNITHISFSFSFEKIKFTLQIFPPLCSNLEFLHILCSIATNYKANILWVCLRKIISIKAVEWIEKDWKLWWSVCLFYLTFKWNSKLFIWDKCIKIKQLPEPILWWKWIKFGSKNTWSENMSKNVSHFIWKYCRKLNAFYFFYFPLMLNPKIFNKFKKNTVVEWKQHHLSYS